MTRILCKLTFVAKWSWIGAYIHIGLSPHIYLAVNAKKVLPVSVSLFNDTYKPYAFIPSNTLAYLQTVFITQPFTWILFFLHLY